MTDYKRVFFLILFFFILPNNLLPIEVGITAGTINKPSKLNYGLSGGMRFIIPLIKFEIEIYKMSDYEYKAITGGIKFNPKLNRFSPYAVIGIGTEFKKIDLHFSQHRGFTFIGGGVHIYINSLISIRGDIRFQSFSDKNKTRFTGGIFLHI